MKVFVSSVIAGLEPYRDAVEAAISSLGHTPIRAETFGASPQTPQRTCLDGVRQADVTVLVVGARYGPIQRSGRSATEEEYREARDRHDVLAMIQDGVQLEDRQREFLSELQSWTGGHYTTRFSTPASLRDAVTRGLHELEIARRSGPVDPDEAAGRARGLLPAERTSGEARVALAITGTPRQPVVRPSQMESADFARSIQQKAMFGSFAVLDSSAATDTRIEGHRLVLEQRHAVFSLGEDGSVLVVERIARADAYAMAIVEEDLRDQLGRMLEFADEILEQLDPLHRMSHLVVACGLPCSSYLGWQTRAEHRASPTSVKIATASDLGPVLLDPPHRIRAAFRQGLRDVAEDLTVLLRRGRR